MRLRREMVGRGGREGRWQAGRQATGGGQANGRRRDRRFEWTWCDFRRYFAQRKVCSMPRPRSRPAGSLSVVRSQGKYISAVRWVGQSRAGQGRAGRVRFRYYSTRAHTLLNVCLSVSLLSPSPLFPYVTKRNVGRCEPSCIRICNRVIEFGLTVAVRANVGRFDLCPVIARTT